MAAQSRVAAKTANTLKSLEEKVDALAQQVSALTQIVEQLLAQAQAAPKKEGK